MSNVFTEWSGNVIKRLHIELSTHCNAACPMCPRFLMGSKHVRSDLALRSVSIEQYKRWLPVDILTDMNRVLYCGTHGDPIMAKDFNEILLYTKESNPNIIQMVHTNGGVRSTDFWHTFGVLSGESEQHISCVFSIDGLEHTNHLYRRNVKWDKLMENAQAFIDAGGRAIWEFLVFRHNEHQVEEATALSIKMGFDEIRIKRPLGFEDHYTDNDLTVVGAYDRDGKLEHALYPATNEQYLNLNGIKKTKTLFEDIPDEINIKYMQEYKSTGFAERTHSFNGIVPDYREEEFAELETMEIRCKSLGHSSFKELVPGSEIYISASGILFPCCYVGTRVDSDIDLYEDLQLREAIKKEGEDRFNLEKHTIKEIIHGGYMDNVYTDSWGKESIECGKMAYCAQTCGTKSALDRIYESVVKVE